MASSYSLWLAGATPKQQGRRGPWWCAWIACWQQSSRAGAWLSSFGCLYKKIRPRWEKRKKRAFKRERKGGKEVKVRQRGIKKVKENHKGAEEAAVASFDSTTRLQSASSKRKEKKDHKIRVLRFKRRRYCGSLCSYYCRTVRNLTTHVEPSVPAIARKPCSPVLFLLR